MSDNIYQAPQSQVEVPVESDFVLASRGARFGASFIDGLILLLIIVPLGFLVGFYQIVFEQGVPTTAQNLTMAVAGVGAFLLVNSYFLNLNGQTIGKKIVGIKIVDLNGEKPAFAKLLGLRYVPQWIVSYIPFINTPLVLIDILFIFRSDKRCVHDLIAGTQVVEA